MTPAGRDFFASSLVESHVARQIIERVTSVIGETVRSSSPLSGGCVADVSLLETASGARYVVKAGDNSLGIEADMLTYLGEQSSLPIPTVVHAEPDLLIMTHVDADGRGGVGAEVHAAELLLELHAVTADQFGFQRDTLIGGLHQPNPWTSSWLEFFAVSRLDAMTQQARDVGRLPADVASRMARAIGRLDTWLDEPEHPSLIHGDIWSGNVLFHDGRVAAFIDPAIYYAHPEIELAFITLFSTFGSPFFDRYQQTRPIPEGFFEQRRHIYNLYPLLVHVRLFGGGYVGQVSQALRMLGV